MTKPILFNTERAVPGDLQGVTMALGDIRVNKRMKVGEMNTDSRIASQILN